jgi:hypothetical protein
VVRNIYFARTLQINTTAQIIRGWDQSCNKGGASGALTPGAVHVGAQN